jgi:trigger factor
MRASTSSIDANKVRLTVVVEDSDMNVALNEMAQQLGRQISIKGFRKGKVPREVLIAHIGGPATLRAEAIRESLPDFYAKAISETKVDPIAQPEITITSGEESGELTFEADVDIRPEVSVSGYKDLRVVIPSPNVSDDEVEQLINRYLDADAELQDVSRPIESGDLVTMDVHVEAAEDGDRAPLDLSDFMYTVGTESLTTGVDAAIVGLNVGETLTLDGPMPGGITGNFKITIKNVQEKILPDFTDEWVQENTDWKSADEMRSEVIEQLRRRKIVEAQLSQRDAILSAVADLVAVEEAPASLVDAEVQERLHDLGHRLGDQGASLEMFLQVTNQTPEDLLESLRKDSLRAVRSDLALRAVAKSEGLLPTEDEVAEELAKTAESMSVDLNVLKNNLHDSGRVAAFEAEVAKMKVNRWLADHVIFVDDQGATISRELLTMDQSGSDGE